MIALALLFPFSVPSWKIILIGEILISIALATLVLTASQKTTAAESAKPVKKEIIPPPADHVINLSSINDSEGFAQKSDQKTRLIDDTQASMIFNQTADSIIELVHQTVGGYSSFMYIYDYPEKSLVLQSFRSNSAVFSAKTRYSLDGMRGTQFFQTVIDKKEINLFEFSDIRPSALFYYEQQEKLSSLLLMPVIRRGTVLGVLGVDSKTSLAGIEKKIALLKKYAELIAESIQAIDALYIKNHLRRTSKALHHFSETLSLELSEEAILHQLAACVEEHIDFERLSLWVNTGQDDRYLLFAARGVNNFTEGFLSKLKDHVEGQAVIKKESVYIPQCDASLTQPMPEDIFSLYVCPISNFGNCFAVIVLEKNEPNAYNRFEREFVETLCNATAPALSRLRLNAHISSQSENDDQTRFDEKISDEISRAKRYATTFALLLVQCDTHSVKDAHGHDAEYFVLDKVSEILKNSIRQIDFGGRLSYDQFGAILIENNRKAAQDCAQRILKNIDRAKLQWNGYDMIVPIKVGIATYGEDGQDPASLIRAAEKASDQEDAPRQATQITLF